MQPETHRREHGHGCEDGDDDNHGGGLDIAIHAAVGGRDNGDSGGGDLGCLVGHDARGLGCSGWMGLGFGSLLLEFFSFFLFSPAEKISNVNETSRPDK